MLTSLRLVNFKNFADETLKLGPFTVIVGANASGKSNIRDAFRFLHGIGRDRPLAEIFGGQFGNDGETVWAPLRGSPLEIVRFEPAFPFSWSKFSISVELISFAVQASYHIELGFNQNDPDQFRVFGEELRVDSGVTYRSELEQNDPPLRVFFENSEIAPLDVRANQPVISQLFEHTMMGQLASKTVPVYVGFRSIRFLDFSLARMREPSNPGAAVLGDFGQNLPTVLRSICADPERKQTLMSWLQELTPMDVQDLRFPRGPNGHLHLRIVERNGREVSADSASDGTLRFLAMLALLLNEEASGTYFFEDIDAGIHPNRLWLLMELIERQTAKGNIQVITTTHNPALLAWMNDTTFENTSVVWRDEYASDSVIRPIADLYNLRDLRKSQGLARLFTSGWLETAMKFSEGDADTDHLDDDDEDDWGMDDE